MGSYLRPTSIDAALAALRQGQPSIVAGGTDFYPQRVGRPVSEDVLDVTAIDGLRGIADRGPLWRIGAATTWSDILGTDLPPLFDGLRLAAREIGGVQIQNAGTICGNLCNASPAADGIPALLTLDARVEIQGPEGRTRLPVGEFVLGSRRVARRSDQLVTAILVPKPAGRAVAHFRKLGARRYLVISIAMVAVVLEIDGPGRVAQARVAVGACSEVARRLPALEADLRGRPVDARLGEVARPEHLAPLSPLDDVRGSAEYRMQAALVLVRRTLQDLGGRP